MEKVNQNQSPLGLAAPGRCFFILSFLLFYMSNLKRVAICLFSIIPYTFSQSSGGFFSVRDAALQMYVDLMDVLPIISMLMVISAGVTYTTGQLTGAETRARANTWATAMLVGAIIGILIVSVAPSILSILYGEDIKPDLVDID
jgi:hypothetical protein